MKKEVLFLILVIILFIGGCGEVKTATNNGNIPIPPGPPSTPTKTSTSNEVKEEIENICVDMCLKQLEKKVDLSKGPCLSDPDVIKDEWVCDVAHSPRTLEDDKDENQCKAFRDGGAKHFVEVDENCNLLRSV